jgi:hypothetical protein
VRTHVIRHGDGVRWGGMIDGHHDAEPIGELVLFDGNPERLGFRLGVKRQETGQKRGKSGRAHM